MYKGTLKKYSDAWIVHSTIRSISGHLMSANYKLCKFDNESFVINPKLIFEGKETDFELITEETDGYNITVAKLIKPVLYEDLNTINEYLNTVGTPQKTDNGQLYSIIERIGFLIDKKEELVEEEPKEKIIGGFKDNVKFY